MRKITKKTMAMARIFVFAALMVFGSTAITYADSEYEYGEWDYDDWDDKDDESDGQGWYKDSEGYWHYDTGNYDVRNEIRELDGKKYYFDTRGRMAADKHILISDYINSTYYHFGVDGAMVKGWGQESGTGDWFYALPNTGEILRKGIVYENGLYYIINQYYMVTGVYNMDWESKQYYDFNDPDSVFCDKYFPYAVGWGTVDMGTGGVTLERLPVSGGMPSEVTEELRRQYFGDGAGSNNSNTSNNEKFSITDNYVPQAMAERGYYSYEVMSRESIETAALGGFTAVYKVKVPQSGSYHTGYLRITVNANGGYVNSSF